MPRPPARDQPSDEDTGWLLARLRDQVELGRRRQRADHVVRGPGAHMVYLRLDGATVDLLLTDHGAELASRTLAAAKVIEHLEQEGQNFLMLRRLVQQLDDVGAALHDDVEV